MSVFVLTPDDQDRLKEAKRLAVANPISADAIAGIAAAAVTDADGVVRGERPDDAPGPQHVDLPMGWRVAISCEEQPIGLCLHVSMSSPTPDKTLPRKEALAMVLDAVGAGKPLKVWLEDFTEDGEVAGRAVNVVTRLHRT